MFRQQIDELILDRAAALFAQQGFAKTSLQDVADAVGLSKAGLLHHFPSKEALRSAVIEHADALGRRVVDAVADQPVGPARDRRALETLVDVAFAHPGLVAMLLAPASSQGAGSDAPVVTTTDHLAMQALGVDPDTATPERYVRALGALASLAVLTLAAHQQDCITAWRPLVVGTCFDALGHPRGADLPDPEPNED